MSRKPIVGRLGESRTRRIVLRGTLSPDDAHALWEQLRRDTAGATRGDRVVIDLADVDAIDGRTTALLVDEKAALTARGVDVELADAREPVAAMIRLHDGAREPRRRRRPEGFLSQVGRATLDVAHGVRDALGFVGAVARATAGLVRQPRSGNWKAVFPTMERCGADAVPIICVINGLVGFIVAYQAAAQLKNFGADLYVADLVGAAMTREMGPLMTAIIIIGRSGAAFAAEIGTMTVSEEIDALRTMGFEPVRYLVLPRLVALVIVMPLLTLLAAAVGIVGGYIVAVHRLDLSSVTFLHELTGSLHLWDVLTGLIKSACFGLAIALISCQQGFATTGGAEGVGRRTTASVVQSLLALIVLDAGFTVLFEAFHV